jgi:hypothetical protein
MTRPEKEAPSYTQIFENHCPYYLMYGMTYRQYWFGDPWMARDYRIAYGLKQREDNARMWLQGLYDFRAFETVLSNAFLPKGKTPHKYIEKPLDIFPKTKAEKEAEAEKAREKAIAFFTNFERQWKQTHKPES